MFEEEKLMNIERGARFSESESLSWFGMPWLWSYLLYVFCKEAFRWLSFIPTTQLWMVWYDVHSRLISLPFRDDVSPYPHEYRKEYRTIGFYTEKYVIKIMISLLRRICQLLFIIFIIIFSVSYTFGWWTESQSFHINKYSSLISYYSDFILCCILIVLLYTSHNVVDKKNNWNVLKMCTLYSCIPFPFSRTEQMWRRIGSESESGWWLEAYVFRNSNRWICFLFTRKLYDCVSIVIGYLKLYILRLHSIVIHIYWCWVWLMAIASIHTFIHS